MSLPETCPFCGAGVHVMEDGKECRSGVWVTFDCHTSLQTVADPRRFQSSECEVRERLRLAARVAELEDDSKRLDWLLRRGVAWRGCYNKWWSEGEWLYEKGKPRDIIDEAMEANP